jgi:glycosyltransferase involved in cell wall biosynthesis
MSVLQMIKKKLSICMIVKNEEKNLQRCLNSIKRTLDEGLAELIIVDTGSTDKTMEIAKEYTKRVFFHPWNGNFSDMRNKSISYAKGEWIFILDADEVLETPEEFISIFNDPHLNSYNTIRIITKSLLSFKAKKYVTHVQERLFRNDGTFRYSGSIHNQPGYKHPTFTVNNIKLLHYGYDNEDKELMEKKFQRTATMLKNELEKEPENVYYRFQLSRSYAMHGEHVIALEEMQKAYEIVTTQTEDFIKLSYYIFGEYARMLMNAKKYEKVIEVASQCLKHTNDYPDLYFYMGHSYLSLNKYDNGINSLEHYLDLYSKYNKNELDLSKLNAIEMYTLDEENYNFTLAQLVDTFFKDQSINFKNENYKSWINMIENQALKYKLLAQLSLIEKDYDQLLNIFQDFGIENKSRYSFINTIETLKKDLNIEENRSIEMVFAKVEDDYGLLNRIRLTDDKNRLLLELINQYNLIQFSDEIIMEFVDLFMESTYLNRFFKKIDNFTIKKIVKKLIDQDDNIKEYLLKSLMKEFKFNDFQNNRIFIAIANVILLSSIEEQKKNDVFSEELYEIFLSYIEKGKDYIKYLYNEKHLRLIYNTLENREEKFLISITLAYDYADKKDYQNFMKYFKEAANEYPYFARLLQVILHEIYLKKADMHEKTGEYLQAIETYENILSLNTPRKDNVLSCLERIELEYNQETLEQIANDLKNKKPANNSNYENLHLLTDSPYSEDFIQFINQNYDKSLHTFILIADNMQIKYVNLNGKNNLYVLSVNDKERISNMLAESKKIFVHYLLDFFCDLIAETAIEGTIHWAVWGGDVYNYIPYELYDCKTVKLGFYNNSNAGYHVNRKKAIRKVDYILTWLEQDYELIRQHYLTAALMKEFMYPLPINKTDISSQITMKQSNANNEHYTFMIGNSGDPTNNHVEIMELLSRYHQENFKVLVPLSYGNPFYIKKIIEKGKELLGDKFIPLTQFMKEGKYINLLKEIDVAFMNHNRQQAAGNIFLLLALNKKVYLKDSSPVNRYLYEKNYCVHRISEIINQNMNFKQIISRTADDDENQQKLLSNLTNSELKKSLDKVFI